MVGALHVNAMNGMTCLPLAQLGCSTRAMNTILIIVALLLVGLSLFGLARPSSVMRR